MSKNLGNCCHWYAFNYKVGTNHPTESMELHPGEPDFFRIGIEYRVRGYLSNPHYRRSHTKKDIRLIAFGASVQDIILKRYADICRQWQGQPFPRFFLPQNYFASGPVYLIAAQIHNIDCPESQHGTEKDDCIVAFSLWCTAVINAENFCDIILLTRFLNAVFRRYGE